MRLAPYGKHSLIFECGLLYRRDKANVYAQFQNLGLDITYHYLGDYWEIARKSITPEFIDFLRDFNVEVEPTVDAWLKHPCKCPRSVVPGEYLND